MRPKVWLFDLDDTLHHASAQVFPNQYLKMHRFIEERFGLSPAEASARRRELFLRWGTTGFGLFREHGISPLEFADYVHADAALESWLRWRDGDWQLLNKLPGRKVLLTNAPAFYTERVLAAIGHAKVFERVVSFNEMRFAGKFRPKPDTRMLRMLCARLQVHPSEAVLVEDTIGHLKAARSIGMRTILTRRYSEHAKAQRGRPAFLRARIGTLQEIAHL
jgi:putative hydrolase of the HAD superfamily